MPLLSNNLDYQGVLDNPMMLTSIHNAIEAFLAAVELQKTEGVVS